MIGVMLSRRRFLPVREREHSHHAACRPGPGIIKSQRAQAIIVYGSSLTYAFRKTIADLVIAHGLSSIRLDASLVPVGHLMSFGWDQQANDRLAADFVDKILRGAKPGDILVQQPTKFRLVINVKRAKALGLTLPPSLLLQADQIIE
jgi:putative ABC transport system substrate-binding protein